MTTTLDNRAKRNWSWVILSLAIFALQPMGCSKTVDPNRPKVIAASGVVTYQGKPVEGADVTFSNETARMAATGRTDSSGRFVLSTFGDGDGAVPGPQKVAIRRVDVIDKTPPGVDPLTNPNLPPPEITWIIPEKYSDPSKSGLTAEVTESGPNDFKFDLK